jgi:endoglucanase
MRRRMRSWPIIAVTAVASVLAALPVLASTAAAAPSAPVLRVDQVGYPTSADKVAYLMLPARLGSVSFSVVGAHGVAYRGVSRDDLGGWNARYRAVYLLRFSALRHQGTYRIRAGGVLSAPFAIASDQALYASLARNGVRYFTSERDGADVVLPVLSRRPANLTDARALVYRDPKYDGNDTLIGGLTRIGGDRPVDVSGGWFDAGGGYEKFGFTASYCGALLLMAARDSSGVPGLRAEAELGLSWMRKLWDPARKVMYVQVGIGNGNAAIHGDYDFWFLPQAEDRLGAKPGSSAYYVEYRPVFEAAGPGQLVSPELAGRYAADYALGAQLAGRGSAGERAARALLTLARSVFAMARTSGVGSLVTTFPHDYYPGTEWKSAMLWGAAEIALADERLGVSGAVLRHDLSVAARWARAYVAQGHPAGGDTFNLYDNGAVAEAELLRALRGAPHQDGRPVIAPGLLLSDLAAQLRLGEAWAHGDPFGLGTGLGSADAAPHAFGLYVTDSLYREYGGSSKYAAFAQRQLGYALGANPWGASFVVGAGSAFPHCMQSEIANLAGSLTGAPTGALQLGATVDGPSAPGNFVGLSTVSGMRACSHGSYGAFNTAAAAYADNVASWPSVEPASDYSAVSLLAFTYGAAGRG